MPDSTAIDTALVQVLSADAALKALCPDGVFFDEAPPNAKRFVIVSIVDSHDDRQFGMRALEHVTYRVTARMLSSVAGNDPKGAAARIDALLEGATLAIADYEHVALYRDPDLPRVRETEVDDVDPTIRWFHRGGVYRVVATTP